MLEKVSDFFSLVATGDLLKQSMLGSVMEGDLLVPEPLLLYFTLPAVIFLALVDKLLSKLVNYVSIGINVVFLGGKGSDYSAFFVEVFGVMLLQFFNLGISKREFRGLFVDSSLRSSPVTDLACMDLFNRV